MLQLITTRNRVYLGFNSDKIKMIPKRYQKKDKTIINNSIVDRTKLRLSQIERFNIEYAYFLLELEINDPFVFRVVKNLDVNKVFKVNVKFGDNRYELQYNNSYYIKIPKRLYLLFPDKSTKFAQQ